MRLLRLCLFAILLLVLLPNHKVVAQREPIKVGCLYPLTGPGGFYGRDSVVAIKIAQADLKSINPDYPQIDVQVEDTRSKSLRSVQIAHKFVTQDNVDFLCGIVSSGIALNVSQLAGELGIFFLGTDHASPKLTSTALHPYYFRMNNGTRLSMLAGAKYIAQNYPDRSKKLKIAFIGPDYDYGYQAWRDLKIFLNKQNVDFEIVGELWPKLFETDYAPYIQFLKDSGADIIVNGQWGLDLVSFVRQADLVGLFETAQFMNFDAGGNYEILAQLGNDLPLGLVLSGRHHLNWPQTEENKAFVAKFHEVAGRYPSYAAQGAYTGILAIAEAVHQAGGMKDKTLVRQKLEGLKFSLPEDPEGFQSYMDRESHQLMQVQAIGKTMANSLYPPATVMLGDWHIYYPPEIWPKLEQE